jgi:hypothetical protein
VTTLELQKGASLRYFHHLHHHRHLVAEHSSSFQYPGCKRVSGCQDISEKQCNGVIGALSKQLSNTQDKKEMLFRLDFFVLAL